MLSGKLYYLKQSFYLKTFPSTELMFEVAETACWDLVSMLKISGMENSRLQTGVGPLEMLPTLSPIFLPACPKIQSV